MWADIDTKNDYLNFSEVAELVTDIVRDENMRPVSIGVFGSWGSGKSTLLNLIENNLCSEDFIVVRFDAWLYQGFDDSRAALMDVIASTLYDVSRGNKGLLAKAASLWSRVDKMRILGLLAEGSAYAAGLPTFGVLNGGLSALSSVLDGQGDEKHVDAIGEAAKDVGRRSRGVLKPEERKTPPREIAAFRREFEDVLGGLNKTLVVFVDNLDRCLPRQTIHTLEALRLFLFMGRTAFVVAADEEMVRHSVSEFFKNPGERHVTDYLDKLIQVPVRVPRLGVQEVRAYLFLLFASAATGVSEGAVELLRVRLESNLRKSWKERPISTEDALAVIGSPPPAEVVLGFNIADRIAPMLTASTLVDGNPRIVKRMLNVVRMRSRIAVRRGMPIDEAMVAKLALFERCTNSTSVAFLYNSINMSSDGKPDIFAILEKVVSDGDEFKRNCPAQWEGKVDFMQEWFSLEPTLAGKDLRPLVYLSRETTPLRMFRGGLSATALDALNLLMRAESRSSPSARAALRAITEDEHEAVMSEMISTFRAHANWSKRPKGFIGALLLAEISPRAGQQLASFVRTAVVGPLPPWLMVFAKEAGWVSTKGES